VFEPLEFLERLPAMTPPPDPKEDPLPQEVCHGTYPRGVTPPASSYYPLHYPRAILTGSSRPSQPATSYPARLPLSFTRPALEVLIPLATTDSAVEAGRNLQGDAAHFKGPRRDVESVPRLPTFPLRWVLDDPRRRPYFVFWTDSGGLRYGLKMALSNNGDAVLVTFESGETYRIQIVPAPCRGGRAWPSSTGAPGAGNRAGTCTS
jgi:hypothetical protein